MNPYEYYSGLDVRAETGRDLTNSKMRRLADDAAERKRLMTEEDRRIAIDTLVRDTVNADD